MDDVHYLFGSVGLFVAAIMNEFWEDMDATDHNCHCNCARVDCEPAQRMRINGIIYEFH